ncbi:MAG: hypothetical protein AAFO94_08800 [Bacteroidota bacterium]
MKIKITIAAFLFGLLLYSCTKPPEYAIEPEIKFERLTKNNLLQGSGSEDSTLVTISFTDGDGDLGDRDSLNLFISDGRTGFLENSFRIPFIPEQGASNGISGEISFALFTTCCIFDNPSIPPCTVNNNQATDEVVYRIYIVDRAGNKSNEVETSPIVLRCD